MIKVGIIGAHQEDAGELLRILIHHPEVDIKYLYAPSYSGRSVTACHHGFIGEDVVGFSDTLNLSDLSVVFIADNYDLTTDLLQRIEEWPELHIIDMSPGRFHRLEANGFEYGLSEINRKPLVRGARLAIVPSSTAAMALVALHPLALNQLLDSDIEISVVASENIANEIDVNMTAMEVSAMIAKSQSNYPGKVYVKIISSDLVRTIRVQVLMKSPLAIAEVNNIFNSVYDDHSFMFPSLSRVDDREVEGTHKCIVSFDKPGAGLLSLETVGDCHMRGGAGDAVHVMNLFFALDEKVGLTLKPSVFGNKSDSRPQTSWFA